MCPASVSSINESVQHHLKNNVLNMSGAGGARVSLRRRGWIQIVHRDLLCPFLALYPQLAAEDDAHGEREDGGAAAQSAAAQLEVRARASRGHWCARKSLLCMY